MTHLRDSEKAFESPWHAEVFALAVHLNESGVFGWNEWAERLACNLANVSRGVPISPSKTSIDGADDYYQVWLATLVEILADKKAVDPTMLDNVQSEWRAAYLRTSHGDPVKI